METMNIKANYENDYKNIPVFNYKKEEGCSSHYQDSYRPTEVDELPPLIAEAVRTIVFISRENDEEDRFKVNFKKRYKRGIQLKSNEGIIYSIQAADYLYGDTFIIKAKQDVGIFILTIGKYGDFPTSRWLNFDVSQAIEN